MTAVGFCGLGVMGGPMAGHLANAGHDVFVFNRTSERADAWKVTHKGTVCSTPADVAQNCDVVMLCVGNDNDVRDVVGGAEGLLRGLRPGALVVDHTTTSADLARDVASMVENAGGRFIDAPVSGGQAGAVNGTLTVMCGSNDESAFNEFAQIASAYSASCKRMGDVGAGQLTKMVNQICIAGLVQALSEGLNFAERAGLDAAAVVEAISKGAAQSWQMTNRAPTMIERKFDFGFAVEWMVKDLGYCVDEAHRVGAALPVTEQVLGYYKELKSTGSARLDTSSLIELLRRS
jgi:3-hydroxyisobutyrate dehydrogenase-like beta-hydroxyacid dehydrogenase